MENLPYGSETISLKGLPLDWFDVVRGVPFIAEDAEIDVVGQALDHPTAGLPLEDRCHAGMKVAVIVPDRTRVCGSDRFLPCLLDRLTAKGLTERDVTIVFAVGTHSPQSEIDQKRLIGEEIWKRWRVVDHNCHDESNLVKVGVTQAGTEVFLNRWVMEADLVIACGAVIHHYFAGMGGGPKLIVPGVAGETTIFANHRRAIASDGGSTPGCQDGMTNGNPLWEDLLEAAKLAPPIYHVGIILDDRNRIGKAYGGDLEKSHQRACGEVQKLHEVWLREKRSVVVVSPGGYPRDINFIQSHKALQHASYALEDQGVLILVAECPDGVGSDTFMEWMKYGSAVSMSRELSKRYTLNGQTALSHQTKLDRMRIICVSNMPDDLVRALGMTPASSVNEAWEQANLSLPQDSKGYILPNGFVDIPVYSKS